MANMELNIGDISEDLDVEIVDKDRLCYLVRVETRGSYGLRTISKQILGEFIDYFKEHPDAKAEDARKALRGESELDRFEYGYAATLMRMAKMSLNSTVKSLPDKINVHRISLQQIFYGAPGTGKSHAIKDATIGEDVIRTTFHPDSDYSTFVGAYKPTKSLLPICDELGKPMSIGEKVLYKEQLVYEFVGQVFLRAYVEAWKKLAVAEGEPQKQYLIIEEINRGNCAQIFGDLFQLLDRNDYGFSDYPIKTDDDLQRELKKKFNGLVLPQQEAIDAMYNGESIVNKVLSGEILLLPQNLYIWATMNTSDQSLFPIDSAFKRRWDWTYIPISNAHKGWTIEVGTDNYDWWCFLEKINEKIAATTNSEDKKLGYFFCKAQDGIISVEKFVGKVLFYLWNDVFKDYELCDSIFDDKDGSKLTFAKFYTEEGRNATVVTEKVAVFLENLGVEPVESMINSEKLESDDMGLVLQ